jgi:hypothetical protein
MKAFTIDALWVNEVNGTVLLEASFALEGEIQIDIKPLSNKEAAERYIESSGKSWILGALEKFLQHKKRIIDAYPDPTKLAAYNKIFTALGEMQVQTLPAICARVLKGQQVIQSLLPSPQNASYQSSCDNLTQIITFCSKHAKK